MARDKYATNVEPRLEEIKEMRLDMTEAQIAEALGVSRASFEKYKNQHPELREALKIGRAKLVKQLKSSLIRKAMGFMYTEKKTTVRESEREGKTVIVEEFERYAQPDTGAIHLLLKNLDDTWRNDDRETMELKKKRLELEREKQEEKIW